MIVGIPEELVDPQSKASIPILRADVDEWCRENLRCWPVVKFVPFAFRQDIRHAYHIEFENDNDAVHFKLRWW